MIHFEKMTVKGFWPWNKDKVYFAVIREGVELNTKLVSESFPELRKPLWMAKQFNGEPLSDFDRNCIQNKLAYLNAEY